MADDVFVDVHFPKAGIDRSMGFGKQPNRPLPGGDYARTAFIGQNVRAFEPITNRGRGGQRAGLSKYILAPVVAGWIIQSLDVIVTTAEPSSSPAPDPGELLTDLEAFYRNDGTDYSGNSHTLTASGSPGTAPGIDGTAGAAMLVDSGSEYLGTSFAITGSFTYAAWLYVPEFNGAENFVSNAQTGPPLSHSLATTDVGEPLVFQSNAQLTDDSPMLAAAWYHVVATWDGTTQNFYVNGVLKDSSLVAPGTITGGEAGSFLLGQSDPTRMQFVGVWTRDLSLAEVGELYNSGDGFDPTA